MKTIHSVFAAAIVCSFFALAGCSDDTSSPEELGSAASEQKSKQATKEDRRDDRHDTKEDRRDDRHDTKEDRRDDRRDNAAAPDAPEEPVEELVGDDDDDDCAG